MRWARGLVGCQPEVSASLTTLIGTGTSGGPIRRRFHPTFPTRRRDGSRERPMINSRSSHFDRSSLLWAQRASGDDTRTPTAFANGIDRGRSGAFLHDAPRALLHHSPDSCVHLRTCFLPLSLSRLLTTVGFPRAAADQSASLLSTPARFTATRVTAHNLETPSWSASLSRGPATLSVRDELWSHMPHAIPLILALRAPCCRMHACSLTPLFFSTSSPLFAG